jgi:hypothetical protein
VDDSIKNLIVDGSANRGGGSNDILEFKVEPNSTLQNWLEGEDCPHLYTYIQVIAQPINVKLHEKHLPTQPYKMFDISINVTT